MKGRKQSYSELQKENEVLRVRLSEAEELTRAISNNEIDAVIVNGDDGEQIFTLRGAEHSYRVLVETMNEGAVTLVTESGHDIFYCNQKFAAMLKMPLEQVIGASLRRFIAPEDLPVWDALIRQSASGRSRSEIQLRAADGTYVPVLLSFSVLQSDEISGLCLVATDLTEQKEIVAAEKLARSILEQAAEAIIVCNAEGRIIRASRQAQQLCGGLLLDEHFDQALRLRLVGSDQPGECEDEERYFSLSAVLRGEACRGIEVIFTCGAQPSCHLLANAGPLIGDDRRIVGCVVTLTDITDRKQAEAERELSLAREKAAREAAEAANRSKDEWLTVVSHELRNPLNAILGYTRLLRAGPVDAQQIKHCTEIVERSARAQLQLIEDLLDTARVVSGKLKLEIQPLNLASVVEKAVEVIYPAADAKSIQLLVAINDDAGQITGDPERLQQVVWNLLSNAVKYTPQGGHVELRLERAASHIEITVHDTGKGIGADFLPHIFDRFSQSDSSSTRRHGGLGLGLALVKHLVELHGGTIQASSTGEGKGASFTVCLPVRAVYTPTDEDEPDRLSIDGLCGVTPLAGVRALVVDDEAEARELLTFSLRQYGAQVTAAASAEEAMSILQDAEATWPDVLISDISMPDADGYHLIRRLREWEHHAGERQAILPAIALTAYSRTEDRLRALMNGFQMHIAKPVEPVELVMVIRTLTR
ncbi:MAG: ATP-binding protein [Blastocatellia bacterium]